LSTVEAMHVTNPQTLQPTQGQPPELGGVRAGPALAATLYILLVGSAVLSLAAHQFPGMIPRVLSLAAPWVFLAFAAVFTLYRLTLVRAKKYPVSKAFFQIGAAVLFFTLLLPRAGPMAAQRDSLDRLISDSDPRVRALAVEVAGYRPDGVRYAPKVARALGDTDEAVRERAHAALVRLNSGADLGSPSDAAALKAWEDRFP
jgi:hypothetical protein